jgi:hypothetical protein
VVGPGGSFFERRPENIRSCLREHPPPPLVPLSLPLAQAAQTMTAAPVPVERASPLLSPTGEMRSSPEVGLWDVTTPSGVVFQSKVVVQRLAEFLLAAEIAFRCLNRGVPKQKLNLFKFSARQMA